MGSVPTASPVMKDQVLNTNSAVLYEHESSNNSLKGHGQLDAIPETNGTTSPIPQISEGEYVSVTSMSTDILEIIFDYALNKFDDTKERLEAGRPKFTSVVNKFVKAGTQIDMALPAFPFKSANKTYKVLGFLPDKAEEIALARLENMCRRIGEIYLPGAKVTIISDGLIYNDLLSISDRDTWFYGEALRAVAVEKSFNNIQFSRLRDFVDSESTLKLPEKLDEVHYVANATNFRRFILNKFGKDNLDIDQLISEDEDTRLTYQGYRRFLMSDLRSIFTLGEDRTSNAYKRETKYLAKQMLVRGYAFAGAIKHNFPNYLRLSIHQSTGEHKVSMSLLNTKTGFTTPWHCSIALMADGEWMSAPMGDFKENPRMKIIYENGRPSYFKEMTEEAFLEEQKAAEQSALSIAQPVIEENREKERNENFFQWEDVIYDVKHGEQTKRSLDRVDGWVRGGTLTALMGVSGAGKTVLLDVLANRPTSDAVYGEFLVNGKARDATFQHMAGYVYQQDLHLATATVKEALIFSAVMRQPRTTSYVEKLAYAEEVIKLIEMEEHADTIIGENLNSEQRKRLAIGVEVAANPTSLILLDQPTSGLDSQAALSICALLRKLADTGLAILCAINQPSARILQSFDRLILLAPGGKQLYFGKTGASCKTMTSYFERNGARPCTPNENPAEWVFEVTRSTDSTDGTPDWPEIWKSSEEHRAMKSKLGLLKSKFREKQKSVNGIGALDTHQKFAAGFDALALQRTFYKYLFLEKTKSPVESSRSNICSCPLTNHASAHFLA